MAKRLHNYKSKIKGISDYKYDPDKYDFQKELTTKLDGLRHSKRKILQDTINEIVLWKIDRYAVLTESGKKAINDPALRKPILNIPLTENVLFSLLGHGIRIPMASTILRFINPKVYQILDQRAYRFVFGKAFTVSASKSVQINGYIKYLEKLQEVKQEHPQWRFEDMDRILYMLDKEHNKRHKLKT